MRVRWMAMITAGLLGWCAAARAEVRYTITALPLPSADCAVSGINNKGQIIGWRYMPGDAGGHGFLYSDGVFADLGTLGDTASNAVALNDNGAVVGATTLVIRGNPPSHDIVTDTAFVWQNGVMQRIDGIGANSDASGINNQGQIAGYHQFGGSTRAFLYSGGGVQDLPTLGTGVFNFAYGINQLGEVVGFSPIDNPAGTSTHHAFLYSGGVMQDLGAPAGLNSRAVDINDRGQILGAVETTSLDARYGVIWDHGVMRELGSLFPSGQSDPLAINNLGQVIGEAERAPSQGVPFFWQDGTMRELNALLPPGSGWDLQSASINDLGQIAGLGFYNGVGQMYVLTPVPEPGASLILALVCVVALQKRRRAGWDRNGVGT